jgi:hypothetical protein
MIISETVLLLPNCSSLYADLVRKVARLADAGEAATSFSSHYYIASTMVHSAIQLTTLALFEGINID